MSRAVGVFVLLIGHLFLVFNGSAFAAKNGSTAKNQWSWAVSSFGKFDGLNHSLGAGLVFNVTSLTSFPQVGDEDPTDKWISGGLSWTQEGFPLTSVIKAAQICITHGGFKAGTLYLIPKGFGRHRIALGNISCGELEDQGDPDHLNSVLKRDCFDLTDYSDDLCEDKVEFFLDIPKQSGELPIDGGAIDVIEISIYGLHHMM